MAHGALGSVSERKSVIFFLHVFFLSNSFLFYAGGLLWLPWEHSKDVSFQHNLLSSRERGVLYGMLKNTSSSREKNEWACEIGPLSCGMGARRAGQVKDTQLS